MIPPGETLLYPEDLVRDLYIISKGFVEVIQKNKRVGVFTEGRYFGLSGLLYSVNTDYMFRTLTHCQILCLSYESFLKVTNSNANFQQEVTKVMKEGVTKVPSTSKNPSKSPSKVSTVTSKKKKSPSKSPSKSPTKTGKPSEAAPSSSEDILKYPTQNYLQKIFDEAPLVLPSEELSQEDLAAAGGPGASGGVTSKGSLTSQQKGGAGAGKMMTMVKSSPKGFLQSLKCLHPSGKFLRGWLTFRIICAVIITIFAPVQLVFPINPQISFIVTLFFDIVAWTDM